MIEWSHGRQSRLAPIAANIPYHFNITLQLIALNPQRLGRTCCHVDWLQCLRYVAIAHWLKFLLR